MKSSEAVTIRPRLGFTTGPLYGFQGMLEAENITSLGAPYNPAGLDSDETDRTVVADPETTEINQAWIAYSRWDSVARAGRQRLVLDNERFIGDVGWRQNQQTFDGLVAQTEVLPNTSLLYGYLSRINRVFGDDHPQGNWNSDSHLLHASYQLGPAARLTGYGYFLNFDDAVTQSTTTAGASLTTKAGPDDPTFNVSGSRRNSTTEGKPLRTKSNVCLTPIGTAKSNPQPGITSTKPRSNP